jgi:hypothetical protein
MHDRLPPAPAATFDRQWGEYVERLRVQLPPAPGGLLNRYVRWVPWLSIVFGVLGFLGLLALLGLGAVQGPFLLFAGPAGVRAGFDFFVTVLLDLVVAGTEIAGGWLMLGKRLSGWWILALGVVINLLTSLLQGKIVGLLISLLVVYCHVQVKPRYT